MKLLTLIVAILLLVVGVVILTLNLSSRSNVPSPSTVASAQPSPTNAFGTTQISSSEWQVVVPASVEAVDSGIRVSAGERIHLSATGRVNGAATPQDGAFGWHGPDGQGRGTTANNGRKGPLPPGESFMALCYRVGTGVQPVDDESWNLAGSSKTFTATQNGILHFTVNDAIRNEEGKYLTGWRTDNQGSFTVRVTKGQ